MKTKNTKEKKGFISKKKGYSVAIRYSEKAIKEKLIKFIPDHKGAIEISLGEIIDLLAKHVNTEVLSPLLIHNNAISMIQVQRNMKVRFDRDFKEGEEIVIPFEHMMPIEFAVAEEALGVSGISDEVKKINEKEYKAAMKRVNDQIRKFSEHQHAALLKQMKEIEQEQAESQETS